MKHNLPIKRRKYVPPPLNDASSKAIFASVPFMAQILKDCVGELSTYSQQEIMELCQKADIHFATEPVHDQQTASEILMKDSGKQLSPMYNLSSASSVEDTSMFEGAVHFDLLIELTIPMPKGEHIAVVLNVEIQNDGDNVCRIIKRGIYYCSRLISRQKNRSFKAPKYENIRKVYSIWLLAAADDLLANAIRSFSLKEQIITAPQSKMLPLPTAYYDMMEVVIAGINGDYMPLGKPNVLELLWLLSSVEIDDVKARQYLQEVFKMEVTETMDTETYNVREALRRFYGSKKIAEMDEEIAQKAEERAEQIAEQKVEETVQKLEAEQKRKTKRECKKAFKAGEERNLISIVTRMFNNGFTVKSIMSICDLSEQDVIAIRDHGCLPK
ncbi:MAG: hypothetical protein K6G44_06110 [Lentisphaeria bacterium]|nr:hypothetical protein [Lentisphaeria bacterium]